MIIGRAFGVDRHTNEKDEPDCIDVSICIGYVGGHRLKNGNAASNYVQKMFIVGSDNIHHLVHPAAQH